MAQVTGTNDISTLLAARFQSVAAFGLTTIEKILQADIAAHNTIMTELVSEMCEVTTDRQRIYGTSADGDMNEVDEMGRASTQVNRPGATVGFPLRLFQYNLGWTAKWMQTKTPADMATMVLAAEKAHRRKVNVEIKKAVYASSNFTFNDHLVDKVDLGVKRFLNADGAAIPDGPNGETFDGSSHTHFTANATLTAAVLKTSINSVIEHGHGGKVKTAINKADEAATRLLTGFVAYQDPRLIFGASTTGIPDQRVDISRLDNRAIGIYEGAEIWVKPWAIANYAFTWDASDPSKPLAFRQRGATALQGLRIAAENEDYPLYSRTMEAEFGIGVWTRTNGAALYFAGGAWADPTISG